MTQLWSWLLTVVGVTGLYLAGRKSKAGWAVGFGAQALWIAYAVATRQWGFIASAVAYGTVYARNWLRWRREARLVEAEQRVDDDRLYLDLKGARERLCRAQTGLNPTDANILQGGIDRIDLVACDLPQWSRHDGGRHG